LTFKAIFDNINPQQFRKGDCMLQEIDTLMITMTPAAAVAVKNIITERDLQGYALRIYIAGGGCCGVNFGMALDNNFRDADATFETNGVKVVVDEVSADYLRGAKIDFVNDPERGAGFLVDSPIAQAGHEHEEGECACGGSCACNN
jgi:iron-sulfur cluster assembly protein